MEVAVHLLTRSAEFLVEYAPAFMRGAWVTLSVTAVACLLGLFVGVPLGWLRSRRGQLPPWIDKVIMSAAECTKAIPVLVLLVWWHYLIPEATGRATTPFVTTAVVLSLTVAVSASEIIGSAIRSIPEGELEAAEALGMTPVQVARFVGVPLATRAAASSLLLLAIDTLKLSTFASVIALGELLHTTDIIIQQRYTPLPGYTALAVIFILLVIPASAIVRRFGRKWAIRR